ncbi:hypothetical protein RvY_14349 [Ramazzottius varieornatus]|uniref:Uncharacterized protein n=1 Tax=Ramazzottius varieornatus TaxID=947166 RepID=A0A1D1VSP9_RAMVA|nr:hypothetical protein RvY_14349 [Ramazzottius varieornatus]
MERIIELYGEITRSFVSASNEGARKNYALGLHFWLISKFDHAEFHHFVQDRGVPDPSLLRFHQDLCLELYKLDKEETPERRLLMKRIMKAVLKANRSNEVENPSNKIQLCAVQPEAISLMTIAAENVLKNILDTVLLQRFSAGCEDRDVTSKNVSLSEVKP